MASFIRGLNLWRALLAPDRNRPKRTAPAPDEPIFQNVA